MPLFIFISGRFSQIRDRRKYAKGIGRLIETFVVFQILHVIARFFMHRGNFALEHILVYPEMTMWYLQCLIYWRLLIYITHKSTLIKPIVVWSVIIASFMISLLAGFVPISKEFSIQRACSFLPFFMMGYYSHHFDVRKLLNRIPVTIAYIGIIAVFGIILLYFNGVYKFLSGAIPYLSPVDILIRLGCLVAAIFLSLLVMRITPDTKRFAKWGKVTLFVYMYHLFFEAVLKIVVNKGWLPSGVIPILMYSVILTIFLIWASKIKFFNIVMNPITHFLYAREQSSQA
jgi:fucose 4-O-acetylase-like acetyltransferase